MTAELIDDCRKQFECWFTSEYEAVDMKICGADGEYFNPETQLAWESWQAARKLV